ncbi:MAG: sugar kinase [Actinomycetota bacterium]
MKRVLVVGEPLIELLEEPVGTIRRGFGGDALNLAVYLARESPELHVMLGSAVGDDRDSDDLLSLCRDEGVDRAHVRRVAGATLGRYRVTVDRSGERAFEYERSESPFRGALVGDDSLPDHGAIDVLCFSGITVAVLHDAGRRALLAYATAVRGLGGMVVYDPNHRPALWADDADAREWTTRIAPIADVLLASAEDGRRLTDADAALEIAQAFRAMGAREVVVTDGSGPCVVSSDRAVEAIEAVRAVEVMDTTAAGDAFDAGYIAARLRGATPAKSAAAGHTLAATVVGHRGALAAPKRIGI